MMKRTLCLLLMLCCFLCPASFAEPHVLVRGEFSGSLDGTSFELESFETQEKVLITGSLFPGYTAIFNKTKYPVPVTAFFRNLRPDLLPEAVDTLRKALSFSLSDAKAIHRSSFFAGDLFWGASSEKCWEFHAAEFISLLQTIRGQEGIMQEQDEDHHSFLISLLDLGQSFLSSYSDDKSLLFRLKSYDDGMYYVLEVSNSLGTVLSASADFSIEKEKRFLICHTENGRYYYHCIRLEKQESQTNGYVELYSSSVPSFIQAAGTEPVLTEQFFWKTAGEGNRYDFDFCFQGRQMEETVLISGTADYGSTGMTSVNAGVSVSGVEQEMLNLRVQWEDSPLSEQTAEKKEIDVSQPAQANEIRLSLIGNLSALAAKVIPLLPLPLQKLISSFLFN